MAPPLSSPSTLNSCSAVRAWTSAATSSAGRPPTRLPKPRAVRPAKPRGRVASFAVRVTARLGRSLTASLSLPAAPTAPGRPAVRPESPPGRRSTRTRTTGAAPRDDARRGRPAAPPRAWRPAPPADAGRRGGRAPATRRARPPAGPRPSPPALGSGAPSAAPAPVATRGPDRLAAGRGSAGKGYARVARAGRRAPHAPGRPP